MLEERSLTAFRLGSANVTPYLVERGICSASDLPVSIDQLVGKNMNLLVQLSRPSASGTTPHRYMVKQGPVGRSGVPKDGFKEEWRYSELLRSRPELTALQALVSQPIAYDRPNVILVCRFFQGYKDLGDFYSNGQAFPPVIAAAMGTSLASFHAATFQRKDYLQELDPDSSCLDPAQADQLDYRHELAYLTPAIFQRVSVDGLKFYELYHSSLYLADAIAKLEGGSRRCCLIHGDLKFNNILVHDHWPGWAPPRLPSSPSSLQLADGHGVVRVIDWEQWSWGDPAFDVGALVADYLRIWLRSLVLSRGIDLAVALKLAAVPLEVLQPSLGALLQAYTAQFPRILEHDPDFLDRVFQFAGLALIHMIQAKLHYFEPFATTERSMLQVAKSLLCQPGATREMLLGRHPFAGSAFDPTALAGEIAVPERMPPISPQPDPSIPPPLWTSAFSPERMLADLIENIRVDPPLIEHPAYKPLNLEPACHSESDFADCGRYHALPDDLRRAYLLEEVKNYLYDIYFSGEQEARDELPGLNQAVVNNTIAGLNLDFLSKLQDANLGTGFVDPGWVVVRADDQGVQIEKEGLRLWVNPDAHLVSGSDLAYGPGACLKMPSSLFAGDCYVAIANAGEPLAERPRIRIFFNISADGAPVLMSILSGALNAEGCRFTLNVLHDPRSFPRLDAVSLETQADRHSLICLILERHAHTLSPYLAAAAPLFSCPLAPGIGLVECPVDGGDFGLSRCELLAEALLTPQSPSSSRHQLMVEQFTQHGLDWSRPYLNPGSTAHYAALRWNSTQQVPQSMAAPCCDPV